MTFLDLYGNLLSFSSTEEMVWKKMRIWPLA